MEILFFSIPVITPSRVTKGQHVPLRMVPWIAPRTTKNIIAHSRFITPKQFKIHRGGLKDFVSVLSLCIVNSEIVKVDLSKYIPRMEFARTDIYTYKFLSDKRDTLNYFRKVGSLNNDLGIHGFDYKLIGLDCKTKYVQSAK